jgi:hypothetical protein
VSEQPVENKSIKESLELLKSLEILAVAGVGIAKDGVGPEDLEEGLKLLSQSGEIAKGFVGLGEVDDELKDLDDAELIQLGSALWGSYKNIRAAAKA